MKLFNIRMKKFLAVTLVFSMICGLFGINFQVDANNATSEEITLTECSDFQNLNGNEARKQAVKTVTWDFADDKQKADFDFYTSGETSIAIEDGILKTTGRYGQKKAMVKTPYEGDNIKSVCVDIIPGTSDRPMDAAIVLGTTGVGAADDEMNALAFIVESNSVGWEDAPNRIDLVTGSIPWTEYSRLISENGAGNGLYQNGVKKPVNLKLEFCGNKIVVTLSLVENASKYVQTEYVCDTSKLSGQIGLRGHYSDASFDNLKIEYLESKVYTQTWDFSDAKQEESFNFYNSGETSIAVQDGILKTTGRYGQKKALVKTPYESGIVKSVSVDLIPGASDRPIDAAIWLGASNVANEDDKITALGFLVESAKAEDANHILMGAANFSQGWGGWNTTLESNDSNNNALYQNGEKKPLNLRLDFYGDKIVATLSLVETPSKYVQMEYFCDTSEIAGQIGLRAHYSDVSFDNLQIKYIQDEVTNFTEDYETISGMVSYDQTGAFFIQDGKLVAPMATGEGKAIFKERMNDYETVSVDIYLGEANRINGGVYLGASGAQDEPDSINAVTVMVESNHEDANQIDIVIGGFPTWEQYHREIISGESALFTNGEKQSLNLKVDVDGNKITATVSLLSDPTKSVTTECTYAGEYDLEAGHVGLRAQYADNRFDNFRVKSSNSERVVTFENVADMTAFDFYHSVFGDGVTAVKDNTLALHKTMTFTEGTLSVELNTVGADKNAGIIFGADEDARNYYLYRLTDDRFVELVKVENGTETVLDRGFLSGGHHNGYFNRLEVVRKGSDIYCYYYNQFDKINCYAVHKDANPLSGTKVGIWSETVETVFKNVACSNEGEVRKADVLIFGHSYTEMWMDYKTHFPEYQSIDNIGIGGAIAEHWEDLSDEIIAYEPKLGIYNIGINDLSIGIQPKDVVESIERAMLTVKEELPEFEVVLIGVSHCPSRENIITQISETNSLMRTLAEKYDWMYYAEAEYLFCTDEGDPWSVDMQYFIADGLHPAAESYPAMAESVRNAIKGENQPDIKTTLWDFSDASQKTDFKLYRSGDSRLSIKDGILESSGTDGQMKAIVNVSYEDIKSISVDIIPGTSDRPLDAGIYLGATDVGKGADQIKALALLVESNYIGWEDAPNRIDVVAGSFPWTEFARVISENGAGNGLYQNGVKKPLNLRLNFYEGRIVATLSLVENPAVYIQVECPFDASLIEGQIGLRANASDVSFDNLRIEYLQMDKLNPEIVDKTALGNAIEAAEALKEADYSAENWEMFSEALTKAKEVFQDEDVTQEEVDVALKNINRATEKLSYNKIQYGFDDMKEIFDFDFYHATSGGFILRDGKLAASGESGEFKAMLKGNNRAYKTVSLDIYPGEDDKISSGLYIYASGAGHGQDKIHAIYVGLESNYTGWEDAPNRVDIVVGSFPTWKELSRTISESGEGNALFTNGEKQPLKLQVGVEKKQLTIKVSLLSNPDVYVETVYAYMGEGNLEHGQVGIRSHYAANSFDNFVVEYVDEEYNEEELPGFSKLEVNTGTGNDKNSNTGTVTLDKDVNTGTTSPETGDQNGMMMAIAGVVFIASFGTILFMFDRKKRKTGIVK